MVCCTLSLCPVRKIIAPLNVMRRECPCCERYTRFSPPIVQRVVDIAVLVGLFAYCFPRVVAVLFCVSLWYSCGTLFGGVLMSNAVPRCRVASVVLLPGFVWSPARSRSGRVRPGWFVPVPAPVVLVPPLSPAPRPSVVVRSWSVVAPRGCCGSSLPSLLRVALLPPVCWSSSAPVALSALFFGGSRFWWPLSSAPLRALCVFSRSLRVLVPPSALSRFVALASPFFGGGFRPSLGASVSSVPVSLPVFPGGAPCSLVVSCFWALFRCVRWASRRGVFLSPSCRWWLGRFCARLFGLSC